MSKTEILEELPKLSTKDREEILNCLWELKESEEGPTEREKVILDADWEEYKKNPNAGSPWPEVKARLLKSKQPCAAK